MAFPGVKVCPAISNAEDDMAVYVARPKVKTAGSVGAVAWLSRVVLDPITVTEPPAAGETGTPKIVTAGLAGAKV